MLTHRALVWNAEAVGRIISPRLDDVFLSCLPLAHAFERAIGYYLPMMGGSTVTYTRSIETLSDDFLAVRPTAFLAVPRLYERIYTAIRVWAAGNPLKRRLLDLTASLGWRRFEAEQGKRSACAALQPRKICGHMESLMRLFKWLLPIQLVPVCAATRFSAGGVLNPFAIGRRFTLDHHTGKGLTPAYQSVHRCIEPLTSRNEP
jgi:hypothetical protein